MRLGSDTIIRIRAPLVVDPEDNTQYRNWLAAVQTEIVECMVMPFILAEKLQFEDNISREYTRTSMRFYVPPKTDLISTDRVLFDSRVYDIFGMPQPWRDFGGVEVYISFDARERLG